MNNSSSPDTYLIRSLIFGLIGIALLAIAVYMIFARYEFLSQAQQAPGVVKALNAGGSHLEIEFTSADNHVIFYPQGGMIFGYKVGQPVQVLYRTENPQAPPLSFKTKALCGVLRYCLGLWALFLFGAVGLSLSVRECNLPCRR